MYSPPPQALFRFCRVALSSSLLEYLALRGCWCLCGKGMSTRLFVPHCFLASCLVYVLTRRASRRSLLFVICTAWTFFAATLLMFHLLFLPNVSQHLHSFWGATFGVHENPYSFHGAVARVTFPSFSYCVPAASLCEYNLYPLWSHISVQLGHPSNCRFVGSAGSFSLAQDFTSIRKLHIA